ncbi:hypothetical protein W911_08105 [Hyphomicrobium nitrativorans NL23]|uniref:Uncharacterized protein n=1 Tax=Hyphomicrobium nitrativorans NL23 TaxID=1029756 RepID=V5SJ34_9HYPH|nr:hypothetical protein [Hyphomicrobium nitrativorans]AHB50100.1 hypothetical protein W911_08105 [Hyphomicrobium nitrativorans NL23]
MAERVADETYGDRFQGDEGASELLARAGHQAELSDESLDAVAGGAPQRFYPLAELFRMVTGQR